jgi:hypothetical protein
MTAAAAAAAATEVEACTPRCWMRGLDHEAQATERFVANSVCCETQTHGQLLRCERGDCCSGGDGSSARKPHGGHQLLALSVVAEVARANRIERGGLSQRGGVSLPRNQAGEAGWVRARGGQVLRWSTEERSALATDGLALDLERDWMSFPVYCWLACKLLIEGTALFGHCCFLLLQWNLI